MKATKAGVVIGQAMNGYGGGGVGEVMMVAKHTIFGLQALCFKQNSRGQVLDSYQLNWD